MATTKVFKNGNSQAIRIPSELQTDRKELIIKKIGETFIAYPVDDPWLPLRQVIGTFPEEYMLDRNQPVWGMVAEREDF
jgi:antitoxin VapB